MLPLYPVISPVNGLCSQQWELTVADFARKKKLWRNIGQVTVLTGWLGLGWKEWLELTGSCSETAQGPWILGSATTEC